MNIEQLSKLLFPNCKTQIGENYLEKNYLENKNDEYHLGIDFIVPEGTVVSVPVDCSLVYSFGKKDKEWGTKLIFKHLKENKYFMLSHLLDITPKIGQVCFAGDRVGIVTNDLDKNAICNLHIQCFTQEIMDKKFFEEYSAVVIDVSNIDEFHNPLEIV